ncbi:alpha/beta hydrolase [Kitasatospora sp. YST-16]|uniref:alpha/beta hydrolase n=1 Tax=Kitasatospora sp. YST-16 TaxID=2998080 RepID=UPI00228437E0|nr:alpha/beta hydrolase [Kitasatospora sp. YST-16]WAL74674.1 alpha/beta hydrolase [Kitasatospora sp. YST-16]WNW40729.1 alpha/beta hydrolase [Streptomyces sp. Li-HN-5-13]
MSADTDPYFQRLLALAAEQEEPSTGEDPEIALGLEPRLVDGFAPPDVRVADEHLPGPHGPVPVRIYQPHGARAGRPVLVWCHGGAFAFGDIDMPEADATARTIAVLADALVVSVDYRRAVHGVHHPVPLDDVVAAYTWATRLAGASGTPHRRIHLGGASAGAALAAGACLRVRDAGGHLPSSLLLLYPCVHPVLPAASDELAAKLHRLPAHMRYEAGMFEAVIENYLGAPSASAPGEAMPAVADLRGLPRTLVFNCEYDALRASGEEFALALRLAGVNVDLRTAPGVAHGHLNRPHLAEAQRTLAAMSRWIEED